MQNENKIAMSVFMDVFNPHLFHPTRYNIIRAINNNLFNDPLSVFKCLFFCVVFFLFVSLAKLFNIQFMAHVHQSENKQTNKH